MMKKKNVMKMAVCAVGLMMMACGNGKKVTVADLAGEWEIGEVNNIPVKAEVTPFLGFNVEEGQLYGNTGCNSLMGTLVTSDEKEDALSFAAVGSTKRMCADMSVEDAVLQALGAVKGFALNGETLLLNDAEGMELMELKKKP